MRVVHLLRKPISEKTITENVLKHGTGAINVDACRTSNPNNLRDEEESGGEGEKLSGPEKNQEAGGQVQPSGRWPPNVVMSHSPGCRVTGVKTEEGYTINRFEDGVKPFGGGADHAFESTKVPDLVHESWECQPGCLVESVDRKFGTKNSGVMTGMRKGWGLHGIHGESGKAQAVCYADSGGVSKFYKQVGGNSDE